MSGKKSNSLWYGCQKCGQRLLKVFATKHNDMNCASIFPILENDAVVTPISKAPNNSKILKLPFIDSYLSSGVIFLSDAIIQECALKTFSWVSVKQGSTPGEESGDSDTDSDIPPVALQVWPIPEATTLTSPHALLTNDGVSVNEISVMNIPYFIQKIHSNSIIPAEYVTIELSGDVQVDATEFCERLGRKLRHRLVTEGNRFRMRYFTKMVSFRIQSVGGCWSKPTDQDEEMVVEKMASLSCAEDEEAVVKKLATLSCGDNLGEDEEIVVEKIGSLKCEESFREDLTFFEVTKATTFRVRASHATTKADEANRGSVPVLEDVGGLKTSITELSSFVQYAFSDPNAPHGILLHGQHGTGKTLLVEAFCNSLKLHAVLFNEFSIPDEVGVRTYRSYSSSDTLSEAFAKALASQPSAVVIENLEVLAPSSSTSRSNAGSSNFVGNLRALITSVKGSKVAVIATSSNVDLLAQDLRTANSFGKEIELPIPSVIQREDICNKILKHFSHSLSSEEVNSIAVSTHGFVGADLRGLFSQAAVIASRLDDQKPELETKRASITLSHVQEAMKSVHPSAMKSILIEVPNVRWDDIGGQKELKLKLKQTIEWPLKHPEAFRRLGISPPKGILMYGPPGCSKTMIARAIATESGLNFISVKSSDLFSKWVGESEKAVQKIFRTARQVAPCIVFFDEIDSLGGERGGSSGSSNVHERVLSQLLIEMDGVEPLKEVTIVAATNRPDIIDQALLRPGRLDRIIYVPLPDEDARREIFKIWFRRMPVDDSICVDELVRLTENYSGAEATAVCHEAALHALDENIEATVIHERHFQAALKTVRPRISKEQILFYEKYNENSKSAR